MRRVSLVAIVGVVGVAALASGRASDAGGRQTVAAPIDKVDVRIRESNPPQVTVKISAGLPSGCAKRDSHSVARAGDTVDLGSSFALGTTYTVRVNDKVTTFKT